MTDTVDTTHAPELTLHVSREPAPIPSRKPPPEALDRVLATGADLVVQGRRVTAHELTRLTGLEPDDVQECIDALCDRGTLEPAGAEPQHYVFPPGRWPVG